MPKLIVFLMLLPFALPAQDVDPLANIKISKDEISKSLDQLKGQGKISESDYNEAQKELKTMSDAQVGSIKDKAIGLIRKDPDKALGIINNKKIDKKELEKELN